METMRINKYLKELIEEFREEEIKSFERNKKLYPNQKKIDNTIINEYKKMNEIELIEKALSICIYDAKETN